MFVGVIDGVIVLVGLFRLKKRPDVVVTSSPTLFSAISGWIMARRWRARWILEVRDLWPSIFADLGILSNPWALRVLTALELFLYKKADHIVVVTEGFKKDIQSRPRSPHRWPSPWRSTRRSCPSGLPRRRS